MLDRESVIRGLECLIGCGTCEGCQYQTTQGDFDDCVRFVAADALAMLKAQEPVKPIERNGFYYCGKCKYAFTVHRQKYCSDCGRKVKWDD